MTAPAISNRWKGSRCKFPIIANEQRHRMRQASGLIRAVLLLALPAVRHAGEPKMPALAGVVPMSSADLGTARVVQAMNIAFELASGPFTFLLRQEA